MEVTHTELLFRKTRRDGVVEGTVLMHGNAGERVQIHCEVRSELMRYHRRVNSALACEAMRQLRRMPEYRRRTRITVSQFGLPKDQLNRVIKLMLKGEPIAGCQAE